MLLVIEFTKEEREATRAAVSELKTELGESLGSQQLKAIEEQCAPVIEKYEKDLSDTKINQYRRDTLDYKNNRVYPWLSGDKPRRRTPLRDGASSSDLSTKGLTTSTHHGNTHRPPFLGEPRLTRTITTRGHTQDEGAGNTDVPSHRTRRQRRVRT